MAESRTKSRTFRKESKRTPSNRLAVHYAKRAPKKAHCANCGAILHAIKQSTQVKIRKLPKSQRRPERPFAGVLCSGCSRSKIKAMARAQK